MDDLDYNGFVKLPKNAEKLREAAEREALQNEE